MKTSNITFYNILIVIMGLLHIWNRNLKEKIQISNFSWVLRHLKIWNMLTKVKIQVARKYPMWVFETTAFEPRSQQSNPEKDPRSPYREIVQKLFKSVHLNIVTKFEQFLSNFSVWGARIFIWIALLWSWFKCGRFEYPHRVLSSNLKFHFC